MPYIFKLFSVIFVFLSINSHANNLEKHNDFVESCLIDDSDIILRSGWSLWEPYQFQKPTLYGKKLTGLDVEIQNAISKIFDYIKSSSDKTPAIPLNALVMKIKQVRAANFVFIESVSIGNESEIDTIVNRALDAAFTKMQDSYINKGKLEINEAERIKRAIELIVYDLRDGGINSGLHKYFLEQFPELTFNDYEDRYQNIFEYLFKVLKKKIAEQLI